MRYLLLLLSLFATSVLVRAEEPEELNFLPPFEGSAFEDPAGFESALNIRLQEDETGFLVDLPTEVEVLQERPQVVALVDIAGLFVVEDPGAPSGWSLISAAGTHPLTWNADEVQFQTDIGTYQASIRYKKRVERKDGSQWTQLFYACRDGKYAGTGVELLPGIPGCEVEFYQFFTLKVSYQECCADGQLRWKCAPKGTRVNIPGGPGVPMHPAHPALADGTQTYTDAPYGDFGRYPSSSNAQGGGMWDPVGGGHRGSVAWPPGFDTSNIRKIKIERRFTTYVVCGGEIQYVYEWDVNTIISLGSQPWQDDVTQEPGGPGPGNQPTVTPADSMEQHHQDALVSHVASMPNQDPGVPLPDGQNR